MSSDDPKPKIGAGHASAMARLGLAELRAAVAFNDSNVVQPSPYGIYGTKTPGEVQEDREASARDANGQSPSVLNQIEEANRGGDCKDREPPQQELE